MHDDMGVPRDANGRPLAKVSMGAEEKIGLANYSNVVLSGWCSRWVEDTPEARALGLEECVRECEAVIAVEREKVLNMVKGKA